MKWLFLAFVISILASCASHHETLRDQNKKTIHTMAPDRLTYGMVDSNDADESADGDSGDAEGGDGDSGQ